MRPIALFALAAALGAAPVAVAGSVDAGIAPADGGGPATVTVQADILSMRGNKEPPEGPDMTAEGNVHVRSGPLLLRAPTMDVFKPLHYGVLRGGVFGVDGLTALMARRLTYEMPDHTLYLDDGLVVVKEKTVPEMLAGALESDDPESMFRLGKNGLTLKADWIRRDPYGHFDAHGVWMTTCVCPYGCTPFLSVSAYRAYVIPKDRAWLTLPIFRFFNVPILPLPVASVPMKSRETGLLFPLVTFATPNSVALPVFITLGDSADLTLSPMYFFQTPTIPASNTPSLAGDSVGSLGVEGPGADALFRWRPAVDASGSLHLLYVFDLAPGNSPSCPDCAPWQETGGKPPGDRGSRAEIQLSHAQGLLGGRAGASADIVTDSSVIADTSPPREFQSYTHSWAEYSRAFGPLNLSIDTNYLQNLTPIPVGCTGELPCLLRIPLGRMPAVFAPLAELTLSTANRAGPAMFEEELNFSYEDTAHSQPLDGSPHQARLIGGLSLSQTVSLLRGRLGSLSLETGERAQGMATPDDTEPEAVRGGGYVGFLAMTRLARNYANGWVHDIIPALQVRGLDSWTSDSQTFAFSQGLYPDRLASVVPANLPVPTWQAIYAAQARQLASLGYLQNPLDMALPPDATVQAIASITTNLTPPKAAPVTLRIEEHAALYQADMPHPLDPGQLSGTVTVPFGLNTIKGATGLDLTLKQATFGTAEYDRKFPFGLLILGGTYLNAQTSDQIARGLDVLFTPRNEFPTLPTPPTLQGAPQQQVQGRASMDFRVAGFHVILQGVLTWYAQNGSVAAYFVQNYSAGISYEAEGCGRLSLVLNLAYVTGQTPALPIPTPNYQFGNLDDLSRSLQTVSLPGL